MKHLLTIVFLCIGSMCFGLNLDSIPQQQRDSILKQMARTTVLLYGPDYYREGKTIIEQKDTESDYGAVVSVRESIKKRKSTTFYSVTTYYDQTKELFNYTYVSKVHIWAVDPLPFEILFGNQWGFILDDARGKKVREISTQFNAHGDSAEIVREGLKLGIEKMEYRTIPLKNLPLILNSRNMRDSISNMMNFQKRLEMEQQIASGPTLKDKIWKKAFKAERKEILVENRNISKELGKKIMHDIEHFNKVSSTEFNQFNTVRNSNKLKKRIILPTFVVNEKDFSNQNNKASISSNMHLVPKDVSMYIGNRKHVFYRITWKKIDKHWEYQNWEWIPLSLSNKLIESGLYKKSQKAETLILQQDGKVKNLVFFKRRKKQTFIDPNNFLNDYQTTFPNLNN